MKTLLVLLCSFSLAAGGFAQAPAAQDAVVAVQPFTSDELDQLLGPIALYPDPLIGLILPASTVPSDIVMADRYMGENGDPAQIANQPWDDSVKGLTHYPDLLKWLDQNLAWTTQLGSAYLAQPTDVMNSIQQLRARAKADGTLMNSDQQQVGADDSGDITISPADADTVYVPQYNTDAVYDDDYTLDDGPVITYGAGCPVGPWLDYWPNWRQQCIYFGDWHRWHIRPGEGKFTNDPTSHPWRPTPGRATPFQVTSYQARPIVARTQPLSGVAIVHSKHPNNTTNPRPGFVAPPEADYTGRGTMVRPGRAIVSRPVAVQPPEVQIPQETAITGYGRGSDARAASERGQFSRQSTAVPYYRPPPPVAAPPVRQAAPVQNFGGGGGAGVASPGARGEGRYGH